MRSILIVSIIAATFFLVGIFGISIESSLEHNSWDRVSDLDVSYYEVRWCPIDAENTVCLKCIISGPMSFCDPRDTWCLFRNCKEWETSPCIAYFPGLWTIGTTEVQTPEGIRPKTFWDTPTPCLDCWDEMCIVTVDFEGNESEGCPSIGSTCKVASWIGGG